MLGLSTDFWVGFLIGAALIAMSTGVVWMISKAMVRAA